MAPVAEAPVAKAPLTKKAAEPETESELESSGEEETTIYEGMSDSGEELDSSESGDEEGASGDEEEEEAAEASGSDGSDDEINEDALLAGLRGSDSELSESEGSSDEFVAGKAKIDLDTDAAAQIHAKLRVLKQTKKARVPGVVYVGRVPHGFYEEEMMGYFKQFGQIKRLRLARNPYTGRSRHYGFIEFVHAEVAQIVADTMDNYLMFERLLKCHVVPREKVHPRMFANRSCRGDDGRTLRAQARVQNRSRTQQEVDQLNNRLVRSEKKRRARIAAAGIDYDFPGYAEAMAPKPKHTKFTN
ncbi:nucleolar protein [Coemansia sp. RSA 552]|nr:nucleolar protein [Coemansia sp. RSA 552]